MSIAELVNADVFADMVAMRRDLHRHPELSWQEERTAGKICARLEALGIPFRCGVAGFGVVADIPGRNRGRVIALRADMDALPVKEETELPFSSSVDGVMHACGHDGHTSMLLGAAALLAQDDDLPATVRLIFQPAEETGRGARAMIEAHALDDVAMIFGGHLDRHYAPGMIAVTDGVVNASSDKFSIEITGQGGHAARPHESVDAVVVGSLMVMAIQTIVSREVNPSHPSVISVGRFDAGTASNVIAGGARLEGSIRAQDARVREHLHTAVRRVAESVAKLHGAAVHVDIDFGTPVLTNHPEVTELARRAARQAVGDEHVCAMTTANMGGEDFSYYLEEVPGCYVRFGGQIPGKENFPAHSSKFDFDEAALRAGAAYYYHIAKAAGEEANAK
ncbi:MAG: amidohydrolase [Planctomycetota bacterium]|nr:MAG: amidohydrolase [Planctomycetota bacterium]REJ96475.1 MAG: amidohydrolase [Planctomycetota bacterium]